MTVTCTICNKTESTQEQFERFHIPTHEHVRMMSAYEKGIEAGQYKQAARIATLEAENARLTAANESMQEDAVQNTYAFELMLKANKEQDEEIRTLKEHLGAIEIITTHSDYEMSYKTFKAIRAHTLLAGNQ